MDALVLMYHQIVPEEFPLGWVPSPLADPRYGVGVAEFSRQMAYLREGGYTILPLEVLINPFSGKLHCNSSGQPAIVVTFDDGYGSDLLLAAPVLAKLGIPATFFVSTGHLGTTGMLTERMVAELSSRPIFRIGGHGETHRFLSDLPERECEEEIGRSFDHIKRLTGQREVEMSAPGGRTGPWVREVARKIGFRALATSRPGLFTVSEDLFSIPRLPVMRSHTLKDFGRLLDPRSLVFRTNHWVRSAKQGVRSILQGLPPGKKD